MGEFLFLLLVLRAVWIVDRFFLLHGNFPLKFFVDLKLLISSQIISFFKNSDKNTIITFLMLLLKKPPQNPNQTQKQKKTNQKTQPQN